MWAKEPCLRCDTRWRHLANTNERSVHCVDAALCRVTLITCFRLVFFVTMRCCCSTTMFSRWNTPCRDNSLLPADIDQQSSLFSLLLVTAVTRLEKTAVNQGRRSDWPHYNAHTCWIPPLPPLSSLCRASWHRMVSQWKPTTMAINHYSLDATVDTPVAQTFLHWPSTPTYDLDFQSTATYGHDPYTCKKISGFKR